MRRTAAIARLLSLGAFTWPLATALASCVARPCPSPKPLPLALVEPEPSQDAGGGPDICLVVPDAPGCQSALKGHEALRRWHSPRCAATDSECGPEVVRSIQKCSPSLGRRNPIKPLSPYLREHLPPCSFDGECKLEPCNKDCRHYRIAPVVCATGYHVIDPIDPVSSMPDPTWCGCVDGQCQLFTQ
jgi:hypothetical protein